MDNTLLIAILIAAAALALLLRKPRPRPLLFIRRESVLTPGERRFWPVLLASVPPGVVPLPKVRVMDALAVPPSAWAEHGAKGSGMHFDFVLADAATLRPLAAVELDDRSHWRAAARERDAFEDAACRAAGLPLVRVAVVRRYDAAELRRRLAEAVAGA